MDHHHHLPLYSSAPSASLLLGTSQQEAEALIRASLKLETTLAAAQEEVRMMEDHALRLARLTRERERHEARIHCHSRLLYRMGHHHHTPMLLPASSSSSDENDCNVSSVERRGLPEKGRLVEAVMDAGPLLQTLLLTGPLPQWRHPPPAPAMQIPPVSIPVNRETEELRFCGLSPSPTLSSPSLSPQNNRSYNKYGTTTIISSFHI